MASEMSKNLFHRVISVSGGITRQMKLGNDNKVKALELARKVGCPVDESLVVGCLMTVRNDKKLFTQNVLASAKFTAIKFISFHIISNNF